MLRPFWILLLLIALCTGVEAVLLMADWGLLGPPRLRSMAYDYGGFWPGLLADWTPNYPLQPRLMFATYGFLHGGVLHLAMNMVTLWSLGKVIIGRVGTFGFVAIYVSSLLGGALAFGLLADTLRPMVGASGALFGLAAAILSWSYVDRFEHDEPLWPVARIALFLVALNIVMWWSLDRQLAWQTHLGGFISGWITALLVDPRAR